MKGDNMKRTLSISLIVAFALMTLVSCAKSDETDEHAFYNYADRDSQKSYMADNSKSVDSDNLGSVCGEILDRETELPVPGAVIKVFEDFEVKADSQGRFEIIDMPYDEYDWFVSAQDYQDAAYLHYDVGGGDGLTLLTFQISKKEKIVNDRELFFIEKDLLK